MYDNHNVFINCPFDRKYQPLEDVIIFTILDCGFKPRSAREDSDSSNRILKIQQIIHECSFGIHDISRTEANEKTGLPRFNMPFELGLFLGAQFFGGKLHKGKRVLIFDKEPHRYEQFISDIKGHDVINHKNKANKVVEPIRNCLAEAANHQKILSGPKIYDRYLAFVEWLKKQEITRSGLSFGQYSQYISEFLSSLNAA